MRAITQYQNKPVALWLDAFKKRLDDAGIERWRDIQQFKRNIDSKHVLRIVDWGVFMDMSGFFVATEWLQNYTTLAHTMDQMASVKLRTGHRMADVRKLAPGANMHVCRLYVVLSFAACIRTPSWRSDCRKSSTHRWQSA